MTTVNDTNAAWGELREGLHIAGYSFERACKRLETLLEDDGWKVGGRFKTVNEFLDSLRFDELKASAEARKRIATRIKELQPEASNRRIGKTLGVAGRTIDRDVATNVASGRGKAKQNNDTVATHVAGTSGAQAAKIVARRTLGVGSTQVRRADRERELVSRHRDFDVLCESRL